MAEKREWKPGKIIKFMVDGEEATVEIGSGNVFFDLGLDNPDERLRQAEIRMGLVPPEETENV